MPKATSKNKKPIERNVNLILKKLGLERIINGLEKQL